MGLLSGCRPRVGDSVITAVRFGRNSYNSYVSWRIAILSTDRNVDGRMAFLQK